MNIIDNIRKYNMVEKQLNGLALDIWYALGLDFNDNMISLISLYNVPTMDIGNLIDNLNYKFYCNKLLEGYTEEVIKFVSMNNFNPNPLFYNMVRITKLMVKEILLNEIYPIAIDVMNTELKVDDYYNN